jgi:uncharacterized protein (TIGR02466 family)
MSPDHTILFYSFVDEQKLDLDTKDLKDFSYFVKERDAGRVISNVGGWQSNNLDIKIPELIPLVSKIFENTERLILKYNLPKKYRIDPLWININGKKDFNQYHGQAQKILKGVFYISAPKDCGNLVMVNPITSHQHYIDPTKIEKFNKFNSYSWPCEPEDNKLIMFPAWIPHFTLPNNSLEDRISIAFNIYCGD